MDLFRKTILYVSDNKFMHIIIRDTLKPHKIDVIDVYSGVEALQLLKNLNPDLILTDIDMPGMTGIELCRTLKETKEYANIPVVIYSSTENDEDIAKSFSVGAKGYIIKKYHKEVLAEKIIHYIR